MFDPTHATEELRRLRTLGRNLLDRAVEPPSPAAWAAALGKLEALLESVRAEHERFAEERQRMEQSFEQMRETTRRCQELLWFARDALLITDLQGIVQEANPAAAALLGHRTEFLADTPLGFYVASEFRPDFYQRLSDLRREKGSFHDWLLLLHPPRASAVHVLASVAPLSDDAGRCRGLRWVLRDVTTSLRAETALAEEKVLADRLVSAAPAIILVLDASWHVLRSNPHLRAVSGYAEEELQGDSWLRLLPPSDHLAARDLLKRALELRVGQRLTCGLMTRQGRRREVAWSFEPLGGGLASQTALLVVGLDITELQEAQRQAVQAERLAAIGQVSASMAHEARNALQRALSCLDRLAWRLDGQPEPLDLASRARSALADLARLFNEVRDYAAPLVLDLTGCHLADVWRQAWEQVRAASPDRQARLWEEVEGVNLWCSADRHRLAQVFRNVFENAFDACAAAVEVDVVCRDAYLGDRSALRVVVRDNGPGLTPEQRERMCEPFYTTRPTGTGLGMAITRRIVEAHGGVLTADNCPKGGAEITLTIPRSAS